MAGHVGKASWAKHRKELTLWGSKVIENTGLTAGVGWKLGLGLIRVIRGQRADRGVLFPFLLCTHSSNIPCLWLQGNLKCLIFLEPHYFPFLHKAHCGLDSECGPHRQHNGWPSTQHSLLLPCWAPLLLPASWLTGILRLLEYHALQQGTVRDREKILSFTMSLLMCTHHCSMKLHLQNKDSKIQSPRPHQQAELKQSLLSIVWVVSCMPTKLPYTEHSERWASKVKGEHHRSEVSHSWTHLETFTHPEQPYSKTSIPKLSTQSGCMTQRKKSYKPFFSKLFQTPLTCSGLNNCAQHH